MDIPDPGSFGIPDCFFIYFYNLYGEICFTNMKHLSEMFFHILTHSRGMSKWIYGLTGHPANEIIAESLCE